MIARLHGRDEFARLRRAGTRSRHGPLWCSYLHDAELSAPHVAFAIGRGVGPAVTRNRLRRRLRALMSDLSAPSGLYLIGAAPSATELTFDQLRGRVRSIVDTAIAARGLEDAARTGQPASTPL